MFYSHEGLDEDFINIIMSLDFLNKTKSTWNYDLVIQIPQYTIWAKKNNDFVFMLTCCRYYYISS